jgi:hypothetical protein
VRTGNFPVAKVAGVAAVAAGGAVAARAVSAQKPATTIVKAAGAGKVAVAKPAAMPVAASTAPQYVEEGSTTLTTVLAGLLALLTWGTAGVLIASYLALI